MDPLKILVVDDEASVRELLRRGLSQMGHFFVDVASNGLEAIEKIEKDLFDLVLTDLKMPEMDGHRASQSDQRDKTRADRDHHDRPWFHRDGGRGHENRSR